MKKQLTVLNDEFYRAQQKREQEAAKKHEALVRAAMKEGRKAARKRK
jgi:hypothetical protein